MIDDWIDVTCLGSRYEERYSPSTGRWQHRSIAGRGIRMLTDLDEDIIELPWHNGRAPSK